MCGIAGIYLRDPSHANRYRMDALADALLAGIDPRGGDACGIAAIGDGFCRIQKAAVRAATFTYHRRALPQGTRVVLLHTRLATQGLAAFPENNHPVRRGPIVCVHNGHIWNDWELFRKHGAERHGSVDTEAVPLHVWKTGGLENVTSSLGDIDGAMAVALADAENPGRLVLARGESSPLVVYANDAVILWASTEHAIREAWRKTLGTPPKRYRELNRGDILDVNGANMRTVAFNPPVYVSHAKTWDDWKNDTYEYVTPTKKPLALNQGAADPKARARGNGRKRPKTLRRNARRL